MICSRYTEPPKKCAGCSDLGSDGLCYRLARLYHENGNKLVTTNTKCPRD